MPNSSVHRLRSSLLLGVALAALAVVAPIVVVSSAPAQAQEVRISLKFRTALEPYGHWVSHPRWHEVWVPAQRPRNWRPYIQGHWIYTDEWGWYWVSDRDEDDFGWVTYHYGRWVFDRDLRWVWVPGDEWAPAWVDWRRGNDYIGWAPLPPDDVVVAYRENPQYWIFVRPRDVVAPRLTTLILPPRQQTVYFQNTVLVNRTVVIESREQRIAVNPGVPPAYIAAAAHGPVQAYAVQPRVLAGTRGVQGAVEIHANEIRPRSPVQRGAAPALTQPVVQKTSTVIQPATTVPPPQPLKADEKGRLGPNPPKAAQGPAQPGSAAPSAAPQVKPPAPPTSQPNAPQPQRQEGQQTPPREERPAAPPQATPAPTGQPPAARSAPPPAKSEPQKKED